MNISDFTKGLTENLNRIAKKEKEQFHLTDEQVRKLAEFYDLKDGPETPDYINVAPSEVTESDIRHIFGDIEMIRDEYIDATRNAIISTLSSYNVIPKSYNVIPKSYNVIPKSYNVIPAKAGIQSLDSRLRGNDISPAVKNLPPLLLGAGVMTATLTNAELLGLPPMFESPLIGTLTTAGSAIGVIGLGIALDQVLVNPGLRRELGGYRAYQQAVEAASPSMIFTVGTYSAEPVTLEPLAMSAPASGTGGNGTPPPPPTETDPNPPEEEPEPEPKDDGQTESRREVARVREQTPHERGVCRKIANGQIERINRALEDPQTNSVQKEHLRKLRTSLIELRFSRSMLQQTENAIDTYIATKQGPLPPETLELHLTLKRIRRDIAVGIISQKYINEYRPSSPLRRTVNRYNDLVNAINHGQFEKAGELLKQIERLLEFRLTTSRYIRDALLRLEPLAESFARNPRTETQNAETFREITSLIRRKYPVSTNHEGTTERAEPIQLKPIRPQDIDKEVKRQCRGMKPELKKQIRANAHMFAEYATPSDTAAGIVRKVKSLPRK